MKAILCDLGLSTEESIIPYHPRVRDREDVAVLKCLKSGVFLLSRTDHMDIAHYHEKPDRIIEDGGRERAAIAARDDTNRRYATFASVIANKRWLDVGTGTGAVLDRLSPLASRTLAVEPQESARQWLIDRGYSVYADIDEVPGQDVEVVTLFHVLEHLKDPIVTLRALRDKMATGGKLIVEVPHAGDFLISFLELDAFKDFTFWSEHLILHTRDSLRAFLNAAGFSDISIQGCQRYPLANHLHWLAREKPGGHVEWSQLRSSSLDEAYGDMLCRLDRTDTLLAIASK